MSMRVRKRRYHARWNGDYYWHLTGCCKPYYDPIPRKYSERRLKK